MWGTHASTVGGLALVYALSLLNIVPGFTIWNFESTQMSTLSMHNMNIILALASVIQGKVMLWKDRGSLEIKTRRSLKVDLAASASISPLLSSSFSHSLSPPDRTGDQT